MITKSKLAELRTGIARVRGEPLRETIHECLGTIETLLDENEKLRRVREAAEKACSGLPSEPPERDDWSGNCDDDYNVGYNRGKWFSLAMIKEALSALANTTGRSEGKE